MVCTPPQPKSLTYLLLCIRFTEDMLYASGDMGKRPDACFECTSLRWDATDHIFVMSPQGGHRREPQQDGYAIVRLCGNFGTQNTTNHIHSTNSASVETYDEAQRQDSNFFSWQIPTTSNTRGDCDCSLLHVY